MANKLISDLSSAAVLVTDLIEHQPIAGPPSKKGTVTALFSDAAGILSINRDNRQLVNTGGQFTVDYQSYLLVDSSTLNSINWENRSLLAADGATTVVQYGAGLMNDAPGGFGSLQWFQRQLLGPDGSTVVLDWNSNTILVVPSGIALQVGNAAVAGVVVPTHTIVLKDDTGQSYRIPCLI